jgi:cysteine-rich repeat protein
VSQAYRRAQPRTGHDPCCAFRQAPSADMNGSRARPGSIRSATVAMLLMAATGATALAQPRVTTFMPPSGPPGTEVAIYGEGFDPRPFATGVAFGGTAVDAFGILVHASGASLTAVVPGGATTGPITVTTGAGSASTAGLAHPTFEVSDVPALLAFFPRSGVVGQRIRLVGRSLRNVQLVTFTGGATVSPPFDIAVDRSGTVIDALVPAAALSGPIAVTTPGGSVTTAPLGAFTIGLPPAIDAFFPPSGPAGTVVTLSGRNIFDATSVRLGGTSLPIVDVGDTGTSIRASIPSGAATGQLTVQTPRGTASTAGLPEPSFVVDAAPGIDGVYPPRADVGSIVTIFGANFGREALLFPPLPSENVVRHGGVEWRVESVSDSRTFLTARVAAGSAGTAAIRVTTPGGTALSAEAFTVSNVPVVYGFQPASGVPGVEITILGLDLAGTMQVAFAGAPASGIAAGADGTSVRATVPAAATTGPIAVTTAGGTASTGDLVPPKLFVVSPSTPCGNGILDFGETCDDGNLAPGDCCSPACRLDGPGAPCADDGNACTADVCDGAGACGHPVNAAACDDGVFCNGADTCDGGECRVHAGDPCAGGPACADVCDEAHGSCAVPAGASCADDADLCTVDACDGAGQCVHVSGPSPACKQPVRRGAARITLARGSTPEGDRLAWRFTRGDATSKAELGDPLTTTAYALCIFDGTGTLLVNAQLPPGGTCGAAPCWRTRRGGVQYFDPTLGTSGLSRLAVGSGRPGRSTASASGRGAALGLPPLPITDLPLTVELHNGARTCWAAVYGTPLANTPDRFRAKSDRPRGRTARGARTRGGPRR